MGGDLLIASRQNRTSGNSAGYGVSAGISLGQSEGGKADQRSDANAQASSAFHNPKNLDTVSGISGGGRVSSGRYNTKETVQSSLTSGGTADINVEGNTHLSGAVLATVDEDGNDLGNLNLTTRTFTYNDLTDTDTSSHQSTSFNANVGLNKARTDGTQDAEDQNGDTIKVNSSQLTVDRGSSHEQGKTLATLGQGNIVIKDEENSDDLSRLNRDTTKTDKDLFKVEQEQTVELTVDHRLLSETGREEIKAQLEALPGNLSSVYGELPEVLKESYKTVRQEATELVDKLTSLLGEKVEVAEPLTPAVDLSHTLSEQLNALDLIVVQDKEGNLYARSKEGDNYSLRDTDHLAQLAEASDQLEAKLSLLEQVKANAIDRELALKEALTERYIQGFNEAFAAKFNGEGGGGELLDFNNLTIGQQQQQLTDGPLKDPLVSVSEGIATTSAGLIISIPFSVALGVEALVGDEVAETKEAAIFAVAKETGVSPDTLDGIVTGAALFIGSKGAIKDGVEFVGKKIEDRRVGTDNNLPPKTNTATQPWKYENRIEVTRKDAETVNKDFTDGDWEAPYKPGTKVTEYTTKADDQFVRVHFDKNQEGTWLMKKEAIDGLSPSQIQKKYSLKHEPSLISDVKVSGGTRVRTGTVKENFDNLGGGGEGAVQYEIIDDNWASKLEFSNPRPIGN